MLSGVTNGQFEFLLANLATNQYSEVGKRMIRLSEHIKEEWLRQKAPSN